MYINTKRQWALLLRRWGGEGRSGILYRDLRQKQLEREKKMMIIKKAIIMTFSSLAADGFSLIPPTSSTLRVYFDRKREEKRGGGTDDAIDASSTAELFDGSLISPFSSFTFPTIFFLAFFFLGGGVYPSEEMHWNWCRRCIHPYMSPRGRWKRHPSHP